MALLIAPSSWPWLRGTAAAGSGGDSGAAATVGAGAAGCSRSSCGEAGAYAADLGQHIFMVGDGRREVFHQSAKLADLAGHRLHPVGAGGIG